MKIDINIFRDNIQFGEKRVATNAPRYAELVNRKYVRSLVNIGVCFSFSRAGHQRVRREKNTVNSERERRRDRNDEVEILRRKRQRTDRQDVEWKRIIKIVELFFDREDMCGEGKETLQGFSLEKKSRVGLAVFVYNQPRPGPATGRRVVACLC